MLSVDNLVASYNAGPVLQGVSLSVQAGEVVALLGRNGVGKSTLLRTLMGLVPSWTGRIGIDGAPIAHVATHDIARMGMALVPQGRGIIGKLSVADNLRAAMRAAGSRPALSIDQAIAPFPALRAKPPAMAGTLSGGAATNSAIARAMMGRPGCCCSMNDRRRAAQHRAADRAAGPRAGRRKRARGPHRRTESRTGPGYGEPLHRHGEGPDRSFRTARRIPKRGGPEALPGFVTTRVQPDQSNQKKGTPMPKFRINRRTVLKTGIATAATLAMPPVLRAADQVKIGFLAPLTAIRRPSSALSSCSAISSPSTTSTRPAASLVARSCQSSRTTKRTRSPPSTRPASWSPRTKSTWCLEHLPR